MIGRVASERTAAVADDYAADEAGVVEVGFDFVHVGAGGGASDTMNPVCVQRFAFDGNQLAGAAEFVAEVAVGQQHARKLTA